MPNITGKIGTWTRNYVVVEGAFYSAYTTGEGSGSGGNGGSNMMHLFSASSSNAIYGSSATVTPLSESCRFYIKY